MEVPKADQPLEEQYRFLQTLIDAIPVPVFHKDLQGRYTLCNKACREAMGLSKEQLIGKTCHEILPAALADHQHQMDQALYRDGKPQIDEITLPASQGPVTVLIYKGLLHNPDGSADGLVTTVLDITDQKKIEKALEASRQEAEAVNRQLQQSLALANEMALTAEHANATKSEFLANMSHEIRTPLTAILGYAELLHDWPRIPDQAKSYVEILHRNGEHLLGLINDILDLSKVEAGRVEANLTHCSLVAAIAEVISMMRVRALEKGLSLTVEYLTAIPETLLLDEAHLRQILVNLIGNATKFTRSGSVRIIVRLLAHWRGGEPGLRIEVVDTGIGIPAEAIPRLGQPFFQVDSSTSRKYGGTGLGLAITRRMVEALHGELTIESVPGAGSTFAVTLPTGALEGVTMIERPGEALHREVLPSPHTRVPVDALTGVRVLLAEDGPDNQLLVSTILRQAGARVEVAENGRIALERALADGFDLVLMDIQMPRMDGYQATEELRRRGYSRPIVALTAHALPGEREKCLLAGCTDYLSKPVDRRDLIGVVQKHTLYPLAGSHEPHEARAAQVSLPAAIISEYADDPALAEIIGTFVAGLRGRIGDMREALGAGLYPEMQRLAHQLKGAGGGYGYPTLTHAARKLEAAAKAADPEAAGLALQELAGIVEAVVAGSRATALQGEQAQ